MHKMPMSWGKIQFFHSPWKSSAPASHTSLIWNKKPNLARSSYLFPHPDSTRSTLEQKKVKLEN